jgi:UDP-N-acetyl-D-glucosamine dehydrogenase
VSGSRILIAGVAYKRDIDDMRESPALDVISELQKRGARVSYADPHVPKLDAAHSGFDMESVGPLDARTLASFDCVAILTDHRLFDYVAIVAHSDLVVDTRNAVKQRAANVFRLGAPPFREARDVEMV